MRAEAPLLSLSQLERLKALWVEQQAPIVEHLRPGLREEEINQQLRPLGLRVPYEAALWWSWYDGVPSGQPDFTGGAHLRFLTLGDAIGQYHESLRIAQAVGRTEDEADRLWNPSWLPVTTTGYGGVIACDCSVVVGEATPVRMVDWGSKEDSDVPTARSFGQMVAWWIEAIECGAWRYDTSLGRWEVDHQRLADPSLELTRLV